MVKAAVAQALIAAAALLTVLTVLLHLAAALSMFAAQPFYRPSYFALKLMQIEALKALTFLLAFY